MDLKSYYADIRAKESELARKYQDGVVYITSLYHREKNSTEGATCSATCKNAARAIVDQTHREATPEEVKQFIQLQHSNKVKAASMEQNRNRQYVMVVNENEKELTGSGKSK